MFKTKLKYIEFSNALSLQILFLLLYFTLIWIFNLITISFASFFHILLNHNLSTIADWVVFRGWYIVLLVKGASIAIIYQFYKIKSEKFSKLKIFLKNYHQNIRYELIVVIFFSYFVIMVSGRFMYNSEFILDLWRVLISILGILAFYLSDLLISSAMDFFIPLNEKEQKIKTFLFPILFFLSAKLSFSYAAKSQMLFFYMMIFYLSMWKRLNWTYPSIYILSFVLPYYILLGADPVWGKSHSLFFLERGNLKVQIFTMVLVSILYLEYHRRAFVEYIYRD